MSVINIKFTKFDNTPWGFRLAGGSDFPQPLTAIKVAEGGLAECMGLKVGDIVTSLNDRPVSSLTHGQVHEALILAGNNFSLAVLRPTNCLETIEGIQDENIVPYTIPLDQLPPVFPEDILTAPVEEYTFFEEKVEEIVEEFREVIPEKPVDDNSEVVPNKDLTDDEIAQLILEEEELLLPDQGVLGVNFKKLRPRVSKLKESKVLEELQKIAVEDPPCVQELKHTSTFLQKPQRPPPPSKSDLEKQASFEGEQYRVVIKKQQKKSVTERLLERGLLEPREDTTVAPPPANEVKKYTPHTILDDEDSVTLVPPVIEISLLQVVPQIREIRVIEDSPFARNSRVVSSDDKPNGEKLDAPRTRDLLKLLDSVQSLEALLLHKCSQQDGVALPQNGAGDETPSGEKAASPITVINDDCDRDSDTCTINYTPWCNAFKSELQFEVPSDDVFAEFTIKIGQPTETKEHDGDIPQNAERSEIEVARVDSPLCDFVKANDMQLHCALMENRMIGATIDFSASRTIDKRGKRLRRARNRFLKSDFFSKKITKPEATVAKPRGTRLRRKGRYLENYLSRNISALCRSLGRLVRDKNNVRTVPKRFPEKKRSYFTRVVQSNLDIFNNSKKYLTSVIFMKNNEVESSAVDFRKSQPRTVTRKITINRANRGRYAERISRVLFSYARGLVSRKNSKNYAKFCGRSKSTNAICEGVDDVFQTTGCFVTKKILGRETRLSPEGPYLNGDALTDINDDENLRIFFSSDNSVTMLRPRERNDDSYGSSDSEIEDELDDSRDLFKGKFRNSIVSDIFHSCTDFCNFAKLAAYALVPFTSIILLYVYK